jgi:hypothetical protein
LQDGGGKIDPMKERQKRMKRFITLTGWMAAVFVVLYLPAGLLAEGGQEPSIEQRYRHHILYSGTNYGLVAHPNDENTLSAASRKELKSKSVGVAAALSLLVPGAGQIYVGDNVKAVPFFLADVAGWATYFGFRSQGKDREKEYQAFADAHWDISGYIGFLIDSLGITSGSDFDQVVTPYSRQDSIVNLVIPAGFIFSHHVPTREGESPSNFEKNFEYYESIGKYDQFFAGWDDPYLFRRTYLDMRSNANSSFSKSKIGLAISLVDRMVAAVDAALSAQRYNKKLDKSRELKIGFRVTRYNGARMPKLTAVYKF